MGNKLKYFIGVMMLARVMGAGFACDPTEEDLRTMDTVNQAIAKHEKNCIENHADKHGHDAWIELQARLADDALDWVVGLTEDEIKELHKDHIAYEHHRCIREFLDETFPDKDIQVMHWIRFNNEGRARILGYEAFSVRDRNHECECIIEQREQD